MGPSERSRLLLAQLAEKSLTLDEFLLKCAEWTTEIIDDYYFKPLPTKPDTRVMDEIPEHQRKMLDSEFFYDYPEIMNYARTFNLIRNENKALYDWLMECRKILLQHDKIESVRRVDQKLKEVSLDENNWPVLCLRGDNFDASSVE